ncbi:hypothetical protein AHTJR_05935 [Acinetobacter haemolyticus]|uniref:Uncharacterized protein n=1 Tax=Acinetobacter haemolyticus TaxID=29430 RepID=A0A4P7B5Z4_ACIHA|nr:hypothetical protein AHTJR_05935 [Acinetobacter haemolyticus]
MNSPKTKSPLFEWALIYCFLSRPEISLPLKRLILWNMKKNNELNEHNVIYAELSGDFPLGDSRQPTYKSLRPFDLVS